MNKSIDRLVNSIKLKPNAYDKYIKLSEELAKEDKKIECLNVLTDLGIQYAKDKKYAECECVFREVLKNNPSVYRYNVNLGTCLAWVNKAEESQILLLRAIYAYSIIAPEIHDFLREELEPILPKELILKARDIKFEQPVPEIVDIENCLTSFGKVLSDTGLIDAAFKCHNKAIEIKPDLALAHWNRALINLSWRNYISGWNDYEWRWLWKEFPEVRRRLPARPWKGERLSGKTLYVYTEQGFGDSIQFFRWVIFLKQYYICDIIFEAPSLTYDLFANNPYGIDVVHRPELAHMAATDKHIDYSCSIMSLPYYSKHTDIIKCNPYIFPDKEKSNLWKMKLSFDDNVKIGLCWSSSKKPDNGRKIPIKEFVPLSDIHNISLYSLQVGEDKKELINSGLTSITDFSNEFKTFSDTAAFIDNLDIVASVDTAVAHLAGAMGKKTYLLLRDYPDWRWADDCKTTPWYKSVHVIKQKPGENWSSVVSKLCECLRETK